MYIDNFKRTLGFAQTLLTLGALLIGAPVIADDEREDHYKEHRGTHRLQIDVAENPLRFVFDEEPVFPEDGMPAYGNDFITQGYIYPAGLLDDYEGVTETGEPTFPEQVIGEWTCRGWFVGDGAHTQSGPMVITTQEFDFYDEPGWDPQREHDYGAHTLVTDGYELIDIDKPIKRGITGGTGIYFKSRGEVSQILLGFGPGMSVKQRHSFKLRR